MLHTAWLKNAPGLRAKSFEKQMGILRKLESSIPLMKEKILREMANEVFIPLFLYISNRTHYQKSLRKHRNHWKGLDKGQKPLKMTCKKDRQPLKRPLKRPESLKNDT